MTKLVLQTFNEHSKTYDLTIQFCFPQGDQNGKELVTLY